jgi:hypothetical protein
MRCSGKLAHDLLCSTLPEMWLFCHTRMPRIMLRSFAHQLRLNDEQREAMYRNYCIQGVTGASFIDRAHEHAHAVAGTMLSG